MLIPTRMRPNRLSQTVRSVFETSAFPDAVEVVIRAQADDQPTIDALPEIMELGNVQAFISDPLGYAGDPVYFWELSNRATGKWVFGFNDDALIERQSMGWDARLDEYPDAGVIIMPQWCKNGGSGYLNCITCPFFIVPNKWWVPFDIKMFCHPTDDYILGVLKQKGWRIEHMRNLSVLHLRDPSDALMQSEGRT